MENELSIDHKDILLFSEHTIENDNMLIIYGSYNPNNIDRLSILRLHLQQKNRNIPFKVESYKKRNDFRFCINKAALDLTKPLTVRHKSTDSVITVNVKLLDLSLFTQPDGVAIVTMVKNYAHRIIEWIDYHLKIGFSKIIIFDNGSTDNLEEVLNKYNNSQVTIITFSYEPFPNRCFADIQRIAHNIGVNGLKHTSSWACLLDADEFIYIPKMKPMNIERFLHHPLYRYFKALCMPSILLTNKAKDEKFDNNLIDKCCYSDNKPKYTKLFINQSPLFNISFIKNPHRIRGQLKLHRRKIYHGHIWANKRMMYDTKLIHITEFIETKKLTN